MLVVVICIGWRCTPAGHEPCHLLFNFEQWFDVSRSQRGRQTDRRRERALDQSQWFGGMLAIAVLFLDRVLSHWAHLTVRRFVCVYLCVFFVFSFHTA